MQVICKHCQSVLQVDSKNHGKKTRCGNCKRAFVIVDPKQVADAKKAGRLAKAKGVADNWKASIKAQLPEPVPALPKREFKKKTPVYNNDLREGGLENWLLSTARQFVVLVYVLGSAFWIFSGTAVLFSGSGEVPFYSLLGWIGFTIVYALIAAPVIALIRIEKHLRVSLIREINKQQEGN